MRFILTDGWESGIAALSERLRGELAAGKQVLWLTSGGSNIAATVQVMENISEDASQNLSVMPNDERYGEVGHPDSNWGQLQAAGFSAKRAKLLPVLREGQSFEETISSYNKMAEAAFADSDVVISQLGIGPDGHVSGILPDSPAATENQALVVGYQHPPLTRLTLTFPALRKVTAAYTFAFGDEKRPALEKLQNQSVPLTEQPAQILKELPEAYVFNDQLGEAT